MNYDNSNMAEPACETYYTELKGICSRNSPERYAAMRDAIRRLEESRKALLEKARLAAAAAETEDETEDEIPE